MPAAVSSIFPSNSGEDLTAVAVEDNNSWGDVVLLYKDTNYML